MSCYTHNFLARTVSVSAYAVLKFRKRESSVISGYEPINIFHTNDQGCKFSGDALNRDVFLIECVCTVLAEIFRP